MLLHKKHGFQYIRHGNWSFFINFAQFYLFFRCTMVQYEKNKNEWEVFL